MVRDIQKRCSLEVNKKKKMNTGGVNLEKRI